MDLVTHGLLGALAVQAACRHKPNASLLMCGRAMAIGALAAMFPDIDYLLFWLDPLRFLADWHRGITHSLVMLPIFALLLGGLFSACRGHHHRWKSYSACCALGLLSHVCVDLLTVYGTQLFAPISTQRFSLSFTYVIDPYFTVVALLTLLMIFRHRGSTGIHSVAARTRIARIGLLLLLAYVALQAGFRHEAKSLGNQYIDAHSLSGARADALPQGLSPFNWKVIIETPQGYRVAYVHLHAPPLLSTRLPGPDWVRQLGGAYRSADTLEWTNELRPDHLLQDGVVREVWKQPALKPFRVFARYPVLARIDREPDQECVWFTDLRYRVPVLRPFFRYGMCRDGESASWALYRIRYFTDKQFEAL